MKITKSKLKRIIKEELSVVLDKEPVSDPRQTPPEKEFVDGPDELAGYIVVRDSHDRHIVAAAPVVRTDGPDRPFLVRTTDTTWNIPFGITQSIYPEVEDVFNSVDSKEDWNNLGIGDHGKVGVWEWEWVQDNPAEKW